LALTGAVLATSYLLDGIRVSGFATALFTAAILGILNTFFRPIALLLTLPINLISLGLFTFIINALILKMASAVIPGFDVEGFWSAVIGSLLISIISWLLNSFISDKRSVAGLNFNDAPPAGNRPANDEDHDIIELEHKGNDKWE